MTTPTLPTQVIKKSLLLHKLSTNDLVNNTLYKKAMDSIFCKPETYFSNQFNNNDVVVGKKIELFPIKNSLSGSFSVPNKILRRKSYYQNPSGIGTGIKRVHSNKSNLLNVSGTSAKNNAYNTKELQSNKRVIDDNELKKIFDDFRTLQKKNSKLKISSSAHDMLEDNPESNLKQSVEDILNSQEKSLNWFKKLTKQNSYLINRLSKKVKQNPFDLNINNLHHYRMKKEIKNDLSEQVDLHNDIFPCFDWELSLRNDPNYVDKKCINYGTVKHPHWQFIVLNPKSDREIIRIPKRAVSPKEQREVSEILEDEYLQNRVNSKVFNNYKSSPKAAFLDDLQINGKDLLTFEQENSKLMKGKKILFVNNKTKFNQDTRNNYIIKRNWSLPVVKKSRRKLG